MELRDKKKIIIK